MRPSLLIILLSLCSAPLISQNISVELIADSLLNDSDTLKVCQGTDVSFQALVDYGNTGGEDISSEFQWTVAGISYEGQLNRSTRTLSFDYPTGSIVSVTVMEPNSGSTATASLVVENFGTPGMSNLFTDNPSSVIQGETFEVSASTVAGTDGYISPFEGVFLSEGIEQTVTFLPDGSGDSYESYIQITSAPPGSVLDEQNSLGSIWASIEHSYLGDLDIYITCPNGTNTVIQQQSGGSCNLGEPWATGPIDGWSSNTTAGAGYLYYWASGATETFLDASGEFQTEFTVGDGPDVYTDWYVPAGVYISAEPLSLLDGCPINGEWTITIVDNIGADNGYLFSWGIEVNGLEFDNDGEYSAEITSLNWEDDPDIILNNDGAFTAQAVETGTKVFNLMLTDEHGCAFEVDYPVEVLSATGINEIADDEIIDFHQSGAMIRFLSEENKEFSYTLLDTQGKIVDQGKFVGHSQTEMPSQGLYVLHVSDGQNLNLSRKFILN